MEIHNTNWTQSEQAPIYTMHMDTDTGRLYAIYGIPARLCAMCRTEWHDQYLDDTQFDYLAYDSPEQLSAGIMANLLEARSLATWDTWLNASLDADHSCDNVIETSKVIRAVNVDECDGLGDIDLTCECSCDK